MRLYKVLIQYDRENAANMLFILRKVYNRHNKWRIAALHIDINKWYRPGEYEGANPFEAVHLWLNSRPEILNGSILSFEEVKA